MGKLYYIQEQDKQKPHREIVFQDKQGTVDIVYKKHLDRAKGDFNRLKEQHNTYGDRAARELANYYKQEQERRTVWHTNK